MNGGAGMNDGKQNRRQSGKAGGGVVSNER